MIWLTTWWTKAEWEAVPERSVKQSRRSGFGFGLASVVRSNALPLSGRPFRFPVDDIHRLCE